MVISGFNEMYSLECDVCGADSGCDFDDFYGAVEYKKDHSSGWTSCKNQDGSWIDMCPDCNGNSEKEE